MFAALRFLKGYKTDCDDLEMELLKEYGDLEKTEYLMEGFRYLKKDKE